MKTNLKTFPKDESDSLEEAVYTAPYQTWKEAFERELKEILAEHAEYGSSEVAIRVKEILGDA